ncbi:unnamed protein product [Enterobius vermicularis]|uniref:NR LBD domain-containing protein n=1 Tax=Enterobius vermicularis TaxID=51028 RepID=A0A0N4UU99_ENTVE|nr:unnamed protein product [Enterobius vermicularis]
MRIIYFLLSEYEDLEPKRTVIQAHRLCLVKARLAKIDAAELLGGNTLNPKEDYQKLNIYEELLVTFALLAGTEYSKTAVQLPSARIKYTSYSLSNQEYKQ